MCCFVNVVRKKKASVPICWNACLVSFQGRDGLTALTPEPSHETEEQPCQLTRCMTGNWRGCTDTVGACFLIVVWWRDDHEHIIHRGYVSAHIGFEAGHVVFGHGDTLTIHANFAAGAVDVAAIVGVGDTFALHTDFAAGAVDVCTARGIVDTTPTLTLLSCWTLDVVARIAHDRAITHIGFRANASALNIGVQA